MIMQIRLATDRDLPSINEIYNQAVRERFCTAHLEPVTLMEREKWFAQSNPVRYPVFVADSFGVVKAWISIGPYRPDREALAHVAEVSYYVDEDERGRGLGSRLMGHAISTAPSLGLSVLIAILLDKNPASLALLNKFGFSRWGTMPGIAVVDNQTTDHLYYGLHLQLSRTVNIRAE